MKDFEHFVMRAFAGTDNIEDTEAHIRTLVAEERIDEVIELFSTAAEHYKKQYMDHLKIHLSRLNDAFLWQNSKISNEETSL